METILDYYRYLGNLVRKYNIDKYEYITELNKEQVKRLGTMNTKEQLIYLIDLIEDQYVIGEIIA